MTYKQWIDRYIQINKGMIRGFCASATTEMVREFPELIRVRGFVHTIYGQTFQHWWCITPYGEIIDPTVSQFDKIDKYEPYNEEKHGPLPVGKCMNCGTLLYTHKNFCNDTCRDNTLAALKAGGDI